MSASLRTRDVAPAVDPRDARPSGLHVVLPDRVVTPSSQPSPIRYLPSDRLRPLWLRLLISLHHGSAIMTFLLAACVLAIYAQIVHSQHQWSRHYQRLEELERQERQLIAASESLREQSSRREALSNKGLEPLTLSNAIFVKPFIQQSPQAAPQKKSLPEPVDTFPLAY